MDAEKLYPDVERAVLWGEPRNKIFDMMAANGISGDAADKLFKRAFRERVSVIRSHSLPRIIKGTLLVVAGAALFAVFWFGFGGITLLILIISAASVAWGGWLLLDGSVDWIMARGKEGSATDL